MTVTMTEPPKRKRASRRRHELPADPALLAATRKLADKRARLMRELELVRLAQLQTVLDLRASGVSLLELAELMGVTKGRAYQLVQEAYAAGLTEPAPADTDDTPTT